MVGEDSTPVVGEDGAGSVEEVDGNGEEVSVDVEGISDNDDVLETRQEELDAEAQRGICRSSVSGEANIVERLIQLKNQMKLMDNVVGYQTANAYQLFHQHLADGLSDIEAGRLVAMYAYPYERIARRGGKVARDRRWYRRRQRKVIFGYYHYVHTGFLMPEWRGRATGKSLFLSQK